MSTEYSSHELKVSYGIGRQMGDQILAKPFEGMDIDAVVAGMADALNQVPLTIPEEEMRAAFDVITARMKAVQSLDSGAKAAQGEAFLSDNAQRDEVNVTDSGLQYEILIEGDGAVPNADATVRAHYHGTLIDGTVFDSSYQRGEPLEIPVGGVIAGWTEALQIMGVGAKWRLFVPHQLAYGEQGAGGAIGPCEALVFDVELLEIVS